MNVQEAVFQVMLVNRDLARAIKAGTEAGGHPHVAWHYLPKKYRTSKFIIYQQRIRDELLPACQDLGGEWVYLVDPLMKMWRYLHYFEEGPLYGCPECY